MLEQGNSAVFTQGVSPFYSNATRPLCCILWIELFFHVSIHWQMMRWPTHANTNTSSIGNQHLSSLDIIFTDGTDGVDEQTPSIFPFMHRETGLRLLVHETETEKFCSQIRPTMDTIPKWKWKAELFHSVHLVEHNKHLNSVSGEQWTHVHGVVGSIRRSWMSWMGFPMDWMCLIIVSCNVHTHTHNVISIRCVTLSQTMNV